MGTVTGSRRAIVGSATLVGVLLCAGAAAAKTVERTSEPDHVVASPPTEAPRPAPVAVAAAPSPTAPAAVLSVTAESTATTAKPAPPTTAAKPTPATLTRSVTKPATTPTTKAPVRAITTTRVPLSASPPKSLSIVPVSGPSLTTIRVTGGGCTGPDGGVALTFVNPQGQPFGGDGTSSAPDGSWQMSISLGANLAVGPYTIRAACQNGSTVQPSYGSTIFTVTP